MNNIPDDIYLTNLKKIGKGVHNIHVIENFLNEEDCEYLQHECLTNEFVKLGQLNYGKGWDINKTKLSNKAFNILEKAQTDIKNKIVDIYNVDVELSNGAQLRRWQTGSKMGSHIDDFAVFDYNIAAIIYLNNDYAGGEIYFSDYNYKIQPKAGSVIIFPGNKYYSHEVLEITSGERYTSPVWFKFTGSSFNGHGKGLDFNNIEDWKKIDWENNIEEWRKNK
jgi:hypothetical protein